MYPLLGPKDVAVRLGVSERTVIRMFNDPEGELKAMQVNGKVWRIRESAVEAYIARHLGPEPRRQPQVIRRVA